MRERKREAHTERERDTDRETATEPGWVWVRKRGVVTGEGGRHAVQYGTGAAILLALFSQG